MNQSASARSTLSVRVAGFLALLYGIIGIFAGASGAATFLPYRVQNNQSLETAAAVTAISAVGALISIAGVVSGRRLLSGKVGAWRTTVVVAVGCVTTVAAFAVVTPPSTPSPVPGGPSAYVFLAVVAAAYGLEVLVLLLRQRLYHTGAAAARGI